MYACYVMKLSIFTVMYSVTNDVISVNSPEHIFKP